MPDGWVDAVLLTQLPAQGHRGPVGRPGRSGHAVEVLGPDRRGGRRDRLRPHVVDLPPPIPGGAGELPAQDDQLARVGRQVDGRLRGAGRRDGEEGRPGPPSVGGDVHGPRAGGELRERALEPQVARGSRHHDGRSPELGVRRPRRPSPPCQHRRRPRSPCRPSGSPGSTGRSASRCCWGSRRCSRRSSRAAGRPR